MLGMLGMGVVPKLLEVQKTWATPPLLNRSKRLQLQVVGSWRDDDGAIYKITMDESGWSCSASIERQDGRRYEAPETIKCYADGGAGGHERSDGVYIYVSMYSCRYKYT